MQIHAHAYTIMFTCKGKVHTVPGTMSSQLLYHDITCGVALESQMWHKLNNVQNNCIGVFYDMYTSLLLLLGGIHACKG